MPNFVESLQGRDLGHLRIIAELWGIELKEQDNKATIFYLASSLLSAERVKGMVNSLAENEKEALMDLGRHAGRLPWAQLTRSYGDVREMGTARRDRELPHRQPASPVEALWYRGMLARAFFDTPGGPEEFGYIPDDLLALLPLAPEGEAGLMGRQAFTAEYAKITLANDAVLDHACTLLAALRMGIALPGPFETRTGERLTPAILKTLLAGLGLVDMAGMPLAEPVRIFLEAARGKALVELFSSWKESTQFNELLMLPGLSPEGNWKNDPVLTRQTILGYVSSIPGEKWWSLDAFIEALKQRNPDFQRPAGDYDSWFIRDTNRGEFLRGFEYWEAVDGRLVRFILTGPLHWLGVLDLASPDTSQEVSAFRLSGWARALLEGKPPKGMRVEQEPLVARSDARISARRLVPRRVRYQLARFCEWERTTPDEYLYQITPASLTKARSQGLSVSQLLALLNRNAKAIPPSLVKALERWDKSGSEARMERLLILRVTSTEVLQALRKSRAGRFLGEPLGPNTIAIKAGAAQKVLGALAELGYLGEIRGEVEEP